jgi:hypothetical protein
MRSPQVDAIAALLSLLTLAVFLAGAICGASHYGFTGWESVRLPRLSMIGSSDSAWYAAIADTGYDHPTKEWSNVVFFPAYPLTGRAMGAWLGVDSRTSLMLVSIGCFALTLVLARHYLVLRWPDDKSAEPRLHMVLALALYPTSIFFVTAHTEAMFLLLVVVTLCLLNSSRPTWLAAAVIGLATGTRPLGVALLLPLINVEWQRASSMRTFATRMLFLFPLAVSGLLCYSVFLYVQFGDPFAFATAMRSWVTRTASSFAEYGAALLSFEPVWSVYVPSSPAYWRRHEAAIAWPLSLQFANPVFYVAACGLGMVGWFKGWLNRTEALLCAGLLLLPYMLHSYGSCMQSHARYAAVVFPIYVTLGRAIAFLPKSGRCLVYVTFAVYLFALSALMGAGYKVV